VKDLDKHLTQLKQQHRYRARRITHGPQQVELSIDERDVINFCSNDYLGFANHPRVKQAMIDGVNKYGAGSGSAHLINGHSEAHHLLEEELAAFTGYPRAILFSTGYMANIGICQALLEKSDYVFEDRLNHASLIDGGLISNARFQRYLHNDAESLRAKLDKALRNDADAERLVLTDAVFSMDGDVADIPKLASLCRQTNSWLMIDDAHGFGTMGISGRGSLQHFDLGTEDVPIYMATLGKAMGTAGAFIAGSESLIETIIQKARTYVYTTAMPAAVAEASRRSLQLLQQEPEHVGRLNRNIEYFKQCSKQLDLPLSDSPTAIQPLMIGSDDKALHVSQQLFDKGIMVSAIRPPTVPEGTSRLRITLSASHKSSHIDQLLEALKGLI